MFGKTFRILSLAVVLGIGTPLLAHAGMNGRQANSATPFMAMGHPLAVASATLTKDEASDLVFMREEEKLARDLYLTFDEKWGDATFSQIASSEQRHMDAILRKLIKYHLADPAAGIPIGTFNNKEVQVLYDELLQNGSQSLLAALKVGGFVEELDIEDNMQAAERATLGDLDRVYEALTCGSRNHLRTFASRISGLTGLRYVAQYLPQAQVDTILQLPYEQCGWR
jgi:hypothetical protein